MNAVPDKFCKLICSLKKYIQQEYSQEAWLSVHPSNYSYFLQRHKEKKNSPAIAPEATHLPSASTHSPSAKELPSLKPNLKTALPISHPPLVHQKALAQEIVAPQTPPQALPAKEPAPGKNKSFTPQPLPLPPSADFSELRLFFKTKFPSIPLVENLLADQLAKEVASQWKHPSPEIFLFSFGESSKERAFLSNLAAALERFFAPTKVLLASKIEGEQGWQKIIKTERLRLIISGNYLHAIPELMKFYHEEAAGKHTLGNIPLFLLSDLSLYLQKPSLKASLWNALCRFFNK